MAIARSTMKLSEPTPQPAPVGQRVAALDLADLPAISPLVPLLLGIDCLDDDAERSFSGIVQSEPLLVARLVALANSAAYGIPGIRFEGLKSAVKRIGLQYAIHIAIGILCARPLAGRLKPEMRQAVWLHALTVAFASREIAMMRRLPRPDIAYLIGLLHDLGHMAVECLQPGGLASAVELARAEWLALEEAEARLFGADHATLTWALLERWRVPADLAAAIRDHHGAEIEPGSPAAVLLAAERVALSEEVAEAVFGEDGHPFRSLAFEREALEQILDATCFLDPEATATIVGRVIAQVEMLGEAAAELNDVR